MITFIKILESIKKHFLGIDFMAANTSFLEPPLRNLQPGNKVMLNPFAKKEVLLFSP